VAIGIWLTTKNRLESYLGAENGCIDMGYGEK
jgi:hypothetical protein